MEEVLKQAIKAGAPIYNAGLPRECYELYDERATEASHLPTISEAQRQVLQQAILDAKQESDPSSAAWILRRAFDLLLGGYGRQPADAAVTDALGVDRECMVLDLSGSVPATPRFISLDDGVMGGVSSSSLAWDPADNAAVFGGEVSTAYNGGFASIRSQPWEGWQSNKAQGLRMLLKGDGRTYKLAAKTDDRYDGISYQFDFPTTPDIWQVLEAPFTSFKPSLRGRPVIGQGPLRGPYIRQLGLMVSKFSDVGGLVPGFRPGRFRLAIKHIKYFW